MRGGYGCVAWHFQCEAQTHERGYRISMATLMCVLILSYLILTVGDRIFLFFVIH